MKRAHSPGQSEESNRDGIQRCWSETVQGIANPRASNVRGPLPKVRWQLLELRDAGSPEKAPARNCGLKQETDPTNRDPERERLWGLSLPALQILSQRTG